MSIHHKALYELHNSRRREKKKSDSTKPVSLSKEDCRGKTKRFCALV